MRPVAILALVLFSASPALAQEPVPPFPWQAMTGADKGAVGTCTSEGGEISGCYMVRCEPGHGGQFAIRDVALGSFGVRSFTFEAGKLKGGFALNREGDDFGTVDLNDAPELFKALTSGAPEVLLFTDDADNSYSTVFELTGAEAAINGLLEGCEDY